MARESAHLYRELGDESALATTFLILADAVSRFARVVTTGAR